MKPTILRDNIFILHTYLLSTLGHPKLTEYHQLWVEPIGLDEVLDGLARSGHFKHMKTLFGIGRDELQGRKIREEAKRKGRHLALFQAISHKVLGPRKQVQKSWLDDLGIYTPCVPTWVPIYDPDDFCINYSSLVERKPNQIQPQGSPLKWDPFPKSISIPFLLSQAPPVILTADLEPDPGKRLTQRRKYRAHRRHRVPFAPPTPKKDQVVLSSDLEPDPEAAGCVKSHGRQRSYMKRLAPSSMTSASDFDCVSPANSTHLFLAWSGDLTYNEFSQVKSSS